MDPKGVNPMWCGKLISVFLIGLACGAGLVTVVAAGGNTHEISGRIVESNNSPLGSVTVTIRRAGRPVPGSSQTFDRNEYYLTYSEDSYGTPISVSYSKAGYDEAYVEFLAGTETHRINKVMYLERTTPASVLSRPFEQYVMRTKLSLAEKGYDPGKADGVVNAQLIDAIAQYQKDRGLPSEGLTRTMLESLER